MWARLLVLSLLALGASTSGAAGSAIGLQEPSSAEVGPVAVTAGPSDWTSVAGDGPAIDVARHGAQGLAPGMRLTIGDPAAPTADHAFALRTTEDEPAVVAIRYTYDRQPPSPAGVSFAVVAADGAVIAQSDVGESPAFRLEPGEVAYVLVTIDTNGATPDDDLSGTLRFVASQP